MKILFVERVIRHWNGLKARPGDFSSLNAFKLFLNTTNFVSFLTNHFYNISELCACL